MHRHCFWFRLLALAAILIQLQLPVQTLALSIGEERKISEQLLFSMRTELRILDDPDISQYINRLGRTVLETVGPQLFDYRFFVVKSNAFNAFAAPGGLVFFYSGLIEHVQNEDQLVSVLAHECGHVVSRHIAERMNKGTRVSALSLLLGIAGLAMGVPGLSPGLMFGSMAAGAAVNLQYSREDEEQADRLAYGWMQKMHRDPGAMEDMLRSMRRISRYRLGPDTPRYLLTHPDPDARLGYIDSLQEMDSKKPKQHYRKTDNFDFLRFRYRVLTESIDADKLRVYCAQTAAENSDSERRVMAHYGLALLAKEARDYDQALQQLARVRERYPDREILATDQAVILIQAGRLSEARPILEGSINRDPTDMYGTFQLARLEMLGGNNVRAEQLMQRVATAMPEYPQVYFELGQIESNRGRGAISEFYLAKYHLYQGRIKLARPYLNRATKNDRLPENMRAEAKAIVDKLKEMEKGL